MNIRSIMELFWKRTEKVTAAINSDPPVVQTQPKCPTPLSSDNGTKADCKAKNHCYCE